MIYQPHMKLTDSSENSVSLELVKKSGIKKDEMHMSALTIEFKLADKIRLITAAYEVSLGKQEGLDTFNGAIDAIREQFNITEMEIKSDEIVTFVGPFFRMTGKGLFMDMKKETIEILKDGKSTFDKESLNI